MEVIKEIMGQRSLPNESHWFFQHFIQPDGNFLSQESENWDFKREWPKSYSDSNFTGICKLICAFSNTSGGFIIFGVDDKTRRCYLSDISVDTDKLSLSVNNLLSDRVHYMHRQYSDTRFGTVNVLAIFPRQPGELPLRFKVDVNGVTKGEFFVRVGHEVQSASARHIPELFFRTRSNPMDNVGGVEAVLPPPPTTIKKFVGRLPVVYELFDWIFNSNQPRQYLYGRGGSGKTAIAYELAKYFTDYGAVFSDLKFGFNQVIFMSAKEKQYSISKMQSETFIGTDFSDAEELFRAILYLGGWSSEDVLDGYSRSQLLSELDQYFNSVNSLIIIDDIDTLTTKGIDPAFDDIYLIVARCRSNSRVLYTLRNSPTHSLANSIEVPGLAANGEYQRFVEVCAAQFDVSEPDEELRDGALAIVSERRPLVVEAIMRLRRTSGSYARAIELFEANAGEGAREYVFQREWAALSSNNYSRYLLAVLALMKRPLAFEDLRAILTVNKDVLTEALAEAREMFVDVEDFDEESRYKVGELTRRFLVSVISDLDKFDMLSARVAAFSKSIYPENPKLTRLKFTVERLLRAGSAHDHEAAWSEVTASGMPASTLEDPRFRALRGYIATQIRPPKLESAREDFNYAMSMNYYPDVKFLKAWNFAEYQSGYGMNWCEKICSFIVDGRYDDGDKIDMLIYKGARLFNSAKESRFDDYGRCVEYFVSALILYSKLFFKSSISSGHKIAKVEEYFRNTTYAFINTVERNSDYNDVVDALLKVCGEKDIFVDPIRDPFCEIFSRICSSVTVERDKQRLFGRLGHLERIISNGKIWENTKNRDDVVKTIHVLTRL